MPLVVNGATWCISIQLTCLSVEVHLASCNSFRSGFGGEVAVQRRVLQVRLHCSTAIFLHTLADNTTINSDTMFRTLSRNDIE